MAYNIKLNPAQEFSPGGEEMVNKQWQFSIPLRHIVNYPVGAEQPAGLVVDTVIKDYFTAPPNAVQQANVFEKYYVKAEQEDPVVNGASRPVFELSGEIPDEADPAGYDIEEGLEVTTTLEYKDFLLLLPGTYVSRINFKVYGETAATELILVETVTVEIVLQAIASTEAGLSKNNDGFFVNRYASLPAAKTADISVQGDFVLQVPEYYNVSGSSLTYDETVDGYKYYNGTGSQTISYVLNTSLLLLADGQYSDFIIIQPALGSPQTILVIVELHEAPPVFSVFPEFIEWTVIEGVPTNPDAIQCWYPGNNPVTVEASPPWLSYTVNTFGTMALVELTVVNLENLESGTYNSIVAVKAGSVTKTVAVRLNYYKKVNLNLDLEGINFTDDYSTISSFYNTNIHDVHIRLSPYVFDFNNVQSSHLLQLRCGIFNQTTDYFIGRTMRNLMAQLRDPSSVTITYVPQAYFWGQSGVYIRRAYLPAKLNMGITFKRRDTGSTTSTYSYNNIQFIKGRRPARLHDGFGILNYHDLPLRVTTSSVMMFNFYTRQACRIITVRNGVTLSNVAFNPYDDRLFSAHIRFSDYTQGDIIEVLLQGAIIEKHNQPFVVYRQKYIVFPEGRESYHIGWVNEYEMMELFEFTGSFTYEVSQEHRTVKTYKKFLEQTEKIDVTKGQKLVCNTGHVLKSNQKKIDGLIASKQAWLFFPQSSGRKPVNLIPVSKALKNEDSDQDTYSFEIEFEINIPNDSEIYPR